MIAAVGGLAGALSDDARAGARAAIGGDVSLRLPHPPDPAQRAFIAATSAGHAETVRLRARVSGPERAAAVVVEVEGVDAAWPLVGDVALEPPGRPADALARGADGRWGAAVDAALLDRLGIGPGATLHLGEVALAVTAVLPAGAGDAPVLRLGPRVLVATGALAGTGLTAPGAPAFWYSVATLPPGTDPQAWIAAVETRFPEAGWRIVDAADGIPGLERVVAIGHVLLLLVAVSVLLIGGVGVAAGVTAHLDRRVRTIAVLRSLGAGRRLVAGVFFVQAMLAGGGAVAAGLALGAAAPLLARLHPGLPFDAAPRWDALAVAAAFGLLATATFAAWSLRRLGDMAPARLLRDPAPPPARPRHRRPAATAATAAGAAALVLLTLAVTGMPLLAGVFAAGALLAVGAFLLAGRAVAWTAGRASGLGPPPLRLALGNLARPGAVTVPAVTALGLCLTLLVAIRSVETSAVAHLRDAVPADAPAVAVLNLPPAAGPAFDATMAAVPGVERTARMPFLHAPIVAVGGRPLRRGLVPRDVAWAVRGDRGVSWAAVPPPGADLVAGRWWPADHAGPTLLSVDAGVAARLGIAVGDRLTLSLDGMPLTGTVANLRRIDWTRLQLDVPVLMSPPAAVPPHRELAAVWAAPAAVPAIEAAAAALHPAAVPIALAPVLDRLASLVEAAGGALVLVSWLAVAAAAAVLAASIAAGYRVRRRDLLVLRLLGARRRLLMLAGMLELGLLGAVTAVPAAGLGTLAAWAIIGAVAPGAWTFQPAATALLAAAAVAGMAAAGVALSRAAAAPAALRALRREA